MLRGAWPAVFVGLLVAAAPAAATISCGAGPPSSVAALFRPPYGQCPAALQCHTMLCTCVNASGGLDCMRRENFPDYPTNVPCSVLGFCARDFFVCVNGVAQQPALPAGCQPWARDLQAAQVSAMRTVFVGSSLQRSCAFAACELINETVPSLCRAFEDTADGVCLPPNTPRPPPGPTPPPTPRPRRTATVTVALPGETPSPDDGNGTAAPGGARALTPAPPLPAPAEDVGSYLARQFREGNPVAIIVILAVIVLIGLV